MKDILKLALHKLRHPFHHICFDRRCCGRCGYMEKRECSFVTQLTEARYPSDSHDKSRRIA